jgi:hypothetical protein
LPFPNELQVAEVGVADEETAALRGGTQVTLTIGVPETAADAAKNRNNEKPFISSKHFLSLWFSSAD